MTKMNQRATDIAPAIGSVGRHSPWTGVPAARRSKTVHQIPNVKTEGFGHAQQRVQADPLFSPFNFSDVNRVQVGFFRKPFLAQASFLATVANSVTENFQLAQRRHTALAEQGRAKQDTPNMGLFLSCTLPGKGVETHDGNNNFGGLRGIRQFMSDKARILVVENEIPTAMMIVSLLTRAGFDVEAVAKGQKAMEIARERKFALIVLETDLPDISGFAICAELRQRHISYRTPIVFLSNQHGEEHREQAYEMGAADFIGKPFDARDFISRIRSHLEERAAA